MCVGIVDLVSRREPHENIVSNDDVEKAVVVSKGEKRQNLDQQHPPSCASPICHLPLPCLVSFTCLPLRPYAMSAPPHLPSLCCHLSRLDLAARERASRQCPSPQEYMPQILKSILAASTLMCVSYPPLPLSNPLTSSYASLFVAMHHQPLPISPHFIST